MSHYFSADADGESSVCLAFGFLSLLVAMLVLVVREDYLEFGLEPGMCPSPDVQCFGIFKSAVKRFVNM